MKRRVFLKISSVSFVSGFFWRCSSDKNGVPLLGISYKDSLNQNDNFPQNGLIAPTTQTIDFYVGDELDISAIQHLNNNPEKGIFITGNGQTYCLLLWIRNCWLHFRPPR